MTIARTLSLAFVGLSLAAYASSAQAAPLRALIMGDDYTDQSDLKTDLIGSDGRFDQFNSAGYSLVNSGLPTLTYLQQFDSILVYTNSVSVDYASLTNTLAAYVAGGGGVVIGTFWGQQIDSMGLGGGESAAWNALNPLTNPQFDAYVSLNLGAYNSSHPLMQGVSALSCSVYCGDYLPGLAPGATLVASWNNGNPLAAYNASQDVVNITLFPPNIAYSHVTGDYAALFANALAFAAAGVETDTPAPGALALLGLGLFGIGGLRRKLKAAG